MEKPYIFSVIIIIIRETRTLTLDNSFFKIVKRRRVIIFIIKAPPEKNSLRISPCNNAPPSPLYHFPNQYGSGLSGQVIPANSSWKRARVSDKIYRAHDQQFHSTVYLIPALPSCQKKRKKKPRSTSSKTPSFLSSSIQRNNNRSLHKFHRRRGKQ